MYQSLLFAIVFGSVLFSQSLHSETYRWSDREHLCTVQSSSYVTTDASHREVWTDAPSDFGIRLSSCPTYRKEEKVWGEKHPNVGRILYECDLHGDLQHRFQVVEPFPPFTGVVPPIIPSRLTSRSLSADTGVLFRLHEDGDLDIGKLHRPNDREANAWKLVKAKCSPQIDE